MTRNLLLTLAMVLAGGTAVMTGAWAAGAEFAGPGPRVTGNSIGGIFPYRPAPAAVYQEIADRVEDPDYDEKRDDLGDSCGPPALSRHPCSHTKARARNLRR